MLPSAEALHLRRVRRNLFAAVLADKISRETVTRRAAGPKQKSELPPGACQAPSGARTKARQIPIGDGIGQGKSLPGLAGGKPDCASGSQARRQANLKSGAIVTAKTGRSSPELSTPGQ